MYIYNITIKIDPSIHEDWLKWIPQSYIPFIEGTGKITRHQLLRLREIDDSEGPTYALQLFFDSKAQYNAFISRYSKELESRRMAAWGEKMLSFATLMEIVH